MISGINPGRLDKHITIEYSTDTRNTIGENEKTWTVLRSVEGSVEYTDVSEGFEGKQEIAIGSVKGKIRIDQSVTSKMRIKIDQDTSYYYIRSIQHWRREGYTAFTAQMRDNE
jgi:head-tail adaptor